MAYNDPNKKSAERASLKKLPAYGRRTEFWVKIHSIVVQNIKFSKMMTIVFRCLCFITILFKCGCKNNQFFNINSQYHLKPSHKKHF